MIFSNATTILDALLASLDRAATSNRNIQVAPAAVLWPDHGKHCAALVPALHATLPKLLTLDEYAANAERWSAYRSRNHGCP